MGAYTNTASIAMVTNEGRTDGDETVIKLGTEYAMDVATVSAGLTNKSADNGNDLTYLTAGLDQQIAENVNWNTTFDYVTGTTDDSNYNGVDSAATSVETALPVLHDTICARATL